MHINILAGDRDPLPVRRQRKVPHRQSTSDQYTLHLVGQQRVFLDNSVFCPDDEEVVVRNDGIMSLRQRVYHDRLVARAMLEYLQCAIDTDRDELAAIGGIGEKGCPRGV